MLPPLGAVDRHARVADTPPQSAPSVGDGLGGLGHEQDEYPLSADPMFADVGSDVDRSVYALPQPVDVEFGADQGAATVLDSEDHGAASGSVGKAGHFVGELRRRVGILSGAGFDDLADASAGFLLEVDHLVLAGETERAVYLRREDLGDGLLQLAAMGDNADSAMWHNDLGIVRLRDG
ncbi:hypothetical protein GCM10023147_12580 [Tsukamurella soli]|uniref:Uncharacterized protein n=1 Tax=Tsukamurella soli TaxID=644556 RepID=A0ABP8JB42_9ACTN